MQILLLAAVITATSAAPASDRPRWSDHYARAKTKAAVAQRPLLVVLEDPSEDSKRFDEAQLASQQKQVELLQHFELCRVDVTTPYGRRVAEAFEADELPMTAITDRSTAYITFRKDGQLTPTQWRRMLELHKDGERVLVWEDVSRPASIEWNPSGCST